MLVGVLALQGDVQEHVTALRHLGCEVRLIKGPADLKGMDALVLPGGESTTMSLLLGLTGLAEPLREWTAAGRPTLGTCAGLVLLADQVLDGRSDQVGLGGLEVSVRRNGYGRQRFSFETEVDAPRLGGVFEAVFIRAPRIVEVGSRVEVVGETIGSEPSEIVVVEQGALIGCAFHPELTSDLRLHERLLELASS